MSRCLDCGKPVRDQTAFLALKRTEMRSDDQVSLYGFMDAQEQLKIEKSLLAGHARMLRDMLAEMKVKLRNPAKLVPKHQSEPKWRRRVKPDMDTRRLLNEIRNMG